MGKEKDKFSAVAKAMKLLGDANVTVLIIARLPAPEMDKGGFYAYHNATNLNDNKEVKGIFNGWLTAFVMSLLLPTATKRGVEMEEVIKPFLDFVRKENQ